jgi:hypothetical protein
MEAGVLVGGVVVTADNERAVGTRRRDRVGKGRVRLGREVREGLRDGVEADLGAGLLVGTPLAGAEADYLPLGRIEALLLQQLGDGGVAVAGEGLALGRGAVAAARLL